MKTLLLWVLPSEGVDTLRALREPLSAFERDRPQVRVEVSVKTADALWCGLFDVLKNPERAIRPDVVEIPLHWTSNLAALGLLEELEGVGPAGGPSASLLAQSRLDGSGALFSAPWWMEWPVLSFRRRPFRDVGLDPETLLSSWEGFLEACRSLGRGRGKRGSRGFQALENPNPFSSVSMRDAAPRVWARGGDFLSPDGSRVLFERSDACRGISDWLELLVRGWMSPGGRDGLPPPRMADGDCAMCVCRRAYGKAFKDGGAVPFPGVPVLTGHGLAILRRPDPVDEARELLGALSCDSASLRYARAIGAFPATEEPLRRRFEEGGGALEAFSRSLASARALPSVRAMGAIERVFDRGMESLARLAARGEHSAERLRQEVVHAAAEADSVLTLYG